MRLAIFIVAAATCFAQGNRNSLFEVIPNPFGTPATGQLRFLELPANGSAYVGLRAPDSITSNLLWKLPSADGSPGDSLTTDGSGNLSFSGSSCPLCFTQLGNTFGANATLGTNDDFALAFETNNTGRMRIHNSTSTPAGAVSIGTLNPPQYGEILRVEGDISLSGSSKKILFDMNSGVNSRLWFQAGNTDQNTGVVVSPSGTAAIASFDAFGTSDPANSAFASIAYNNGPKVRSDKTGTASYMDLGFDVGGGEKFRMGTTGVFTALGGAAVPLVLQRSSRNATSEIFFENTGAAEGDWHVGILANGAESSLVAIHNGTPRLTIEETGLLTMSAGANFSGIVSTTTFNATGNPAYRVGGTTIIDSSRVFSNIASFTTDLLPTADNTQDVGSQAARWQDVHAVNLVAWNATTGSQRWEATGATLKGINSSGATKWVADTTGDTTMRVLTLTAVDGTNEGGEISWSGAASYPAWSQDIFQDNMRYFLTNNSVTPEMQIFNNGTGGDARITLEGMLKITNPSNNTTLITLQRGAQNTASQIFYENTAGASGDWAAGLVANGAQSMYALVHNGSSHLTVTEGGQLDISGPIVGASTVSGTTFNATSNPAYRVGGTTIINSSRQFQNIAGVGTNLDPITDNTYTLGTSALRYNSIESQQFTSRTAASGTRRCAVSGSGLSCVDGAGATMFSFSSLGASVWPNGSGGLTQVISVRKGDDSGSCTITVSAGGITATTC